MGLIRCFARSKRPPGISLTSATPKTGPTGSLGARTTGSGCRPARFPCVRNGLSMKGRSACLSHAAAQPHPKSSANGRYRWMSSAKACSKTASSGKRPTSSFDVRTRSTRRTGSYGIRRIRRWSPSAPCRYRSSGMRRLPGAMWTSSAERPLKRRGASRAGGSRCLLPDAATLERAPVTD